MPRTAHPSPGLAAWLASLAIAIALLLPALGAHHLIAHGNAHAPAAAPVCDGHAHGPESAHGDEADPQDECSLCSLLALAASPCLAEPSADLPVGVATGAAVPATATIPLRGGCHDGSPWARGPPRAVAAI